MTMKMRAVTTGLLVALAVSDAALAGPGLKGTSVPIEGSCEILGAQLSQPMGTTGRFGTLTLSCQFASPVDVVSGKGYIVSWVAGPPSGGFLPIVGSTHIRYTGATGEQLDSIFTLAGKIDLAANNLVWQGTEIYEGGTGKYSQATGTSTVFGSTDLSTDKGQTVTFGLINF